MQKEHHYSDRYSKLQPASQNDHGKYRATLNQPDILPISGNEPPRQSLDNLFSKLQKPRVYVP